MPELAAKARDYAISAHARINQLRKYTFQPYDIHLKGVADLVAMVTDDEETIAAAWLHDTVEDTPATFEDIEREFGPVVKTVVMELTDISRPGDGNRALRKEIDLDHTAMASARAKTIKLADLIDNCIDICRNDHKFGPVYLQEMVALMDVLHEGNQRLYRKALKTVDSAAKSLGIAVPASRRITRQPPGEGLSPHAVYADQHGIRVFTTSFQARDILEPLPSFDSEHLDKAAILKGGAGKSSAVGIRIDGKVSGYVLHEDLLSDAPLTARQILRQQTVETDTPLAEVIHILTMFSCCFVTVGGAVSGVISRQDIEKPVVRMWLFGIIILIEMILMKHIRLKWPDGTWQQLLTAGRIEKAAVLQRLRRERGLEVELLDCLQFSDKLNISINEPDFLKSTGFMSSRAAKRVIKDLESLRNNLAHGQDISSQDWPPIARLARRVQEMLSAAD